MSLLLESEKKIDVNVLQKQSFSIDDHRVVIKFKEGEEVFNLNEVTKVRLQKERNVSINSILLLFTLLMYSITSDYYDFFEGHFTYHFLSYAFTIVGIIVSVSVEFYTYELYIHTKNRGFKKLRLSKKDESQAMYFASLFKSDSFKQCN
jgi:hypothetical protein